MQTREVGFTPRLARKFVERDSRSSTICLMSRAIPLSSFSTGRTVGYSVYRDCGSCVTSV